MDSSSRSSAVVSSPSNHTDVILGEGVAVETSITPAAIRILSGLIDFLVYTGLVSLLTFLVMRARPEASEAFLVAMANVNMVVVWLVFPIVFELSTTGRSLGKLITRTRVVRTDLAAVGFRQSFIRSLLRLIELILFALPLIISLLTTRRTQRLGDLAAGTIVVNEHVPLQVSSVAPMPAPLMSWAVNADLGAIPQSLALAIRQFLLRKDRFSTPMRLQIAADLSANLRAYVMPLPPPGTPDEVFLTAVLSERGRRERFRLYRQQQLVRSVLGDERGGAVVDAKVPGPGQRV